MVKYQSTDDKLEILSQALKDIMYPLAALKRKLKEDEILNEYAAKLINDPNHLKSIAKEALRKIGVMI